MIYKYRLRFNRPQSNSRTEAFYSSPEECARVAKEVYSQEKRRSTQAQLDALENSFELAKVSFAEEKEFSEKKKPHTVEGIWSGAFHGMDGLDSEINYFKRKNESKEEKTVVKDNKIGRNTRFVPNDDISGINESIGFVRDAKNPTEKYIPVYKLDDYIGDDLFERGRYLNFVEDFLAHEVNPQYDYVNLYIDDSGEDDILSPEFIMVDDIVGLEPIPAYEFLSPDFDKKYLKGATEETVEDVRYVRRALKNELYELGEILKDEISDYGFVQKTKKLTEGNSSHSIEIYTDRYGKEKADLYYDDIEVDVIKWNPNPWANPGWDYEVTNTYSVDHTYTVDLEDVITYLYENIDWKKEDTDGILTYDEDTLVAYIKENLSRLIDEFEDGILDYYRDSAEQEARDEFEVPEPDYY